MSLNRLIFNLQHLNNIFGTHLNHLNKYEQNMTQVSTYFFHITY